jgi:hypothetical protein
MRPAALQGPENNRLCLGKDLTAGTQLLFPLIRNGYRIRLKLSHSLHVRQIQINDSVLFASPILRATFGLRNRRGQGSAELGWANWCYVLQASRLLSRAVVAVGLANVSCQRVLMLAGLESENRSCGEIEIPANVSLPIEKPGRCAMRISARAFLFRLGP